jgi:phage gp36-like protein
MAYLTQAEYIERFGELETIRVTDESKTGALDVEKLQAAIDGAEEFVDGYLAVRYPLPLASAPELVLEITADLARERLFKTRPLPAVTEAADRARAYLKDLSAGRAVLMIAEEVVVADTMTALPVTAPALPPRIFNYEKLTGFIDLEGYGLGFGD